MAFAQDMANSVKSYKTVAAAISAVRKLHQYADKTTRGFQHFRLALTLKGITRRCTHVTKQASTMTPEILLKIYDHIDTTQVEDAVFWLICIFSFLLLLRKSNILPDKMSSFQADKLLSWKEIMYSGNNLIVNIRWSKTDQFGRQLKSYPLPIIPSSNLCPLKAANQVIKLTQPSPEGHLAALPHGILTYRRFQNKLRSVLAEAGVSGSHRFSSHSFRRGGATFAYLCGVPTEIIKLLGNWRSDCFLRYLHLPLEARLAATELMKIKIMYTSFKFRG